MFPNASTVTLQTPMHIALSRYSIYSPFPTPPHPASRDPGASKRVPRHCIFAARVTLAMQLLKNFLWILFLASHIEDKSEY